MATPATCTLPDTRGRQPSTASSSSRLAVARHAGHADQLAGLHVEGGVLDGQAPVVAPHRDAVDHQPGRVARRPSARPAAAAATEPTMASTSSSSVSVDGSTPDEDHLAAAQHGGPVGDLADLGQLVGDDHDAEAVGSRSWSTSARRASTSWGASALVGSSRMSDPGAQHAAPGGSRSAGAAPATGRAPWRRGRRGCRSARRPRPAACAGRPGRACRRRSRRPARRSRPR